MTITRRLFSRWTAAAPAVGFAALKMPQVVAESAKHDTAGLIGLVNRSEKYPLTRSVDPEGVAQYWNARAELSNANRYKNMLGNARRDVFREGFPPTIDCLKSVSKVHKHYMMVERRLKNEEDERTFTEMLMDKFGVREWFQKQHDRNGSTQAESAGYGGGM